MTIFRRLGLAVLFALVAVAPAVARAGAPGLPEQSDRWYTIEMQGRRTGSVREQVRTERRDGVDVIVTTSRSRMAVLRDTTEVEVEIAWAFVETLDHRPLSMSTTTRTGTRPTTVDYTFADDSVEVRTRQDGAEPSVQRQAPATGACLTPAAADEALRDAIARGDAHLSLRLLTPEGGLEPSTTTRTLLRREEGDVLGVRTPLVVWEVTSDARPGAKATEWTDGSGRTVRSELVVAGLQVASALAPGPVGEPTDRPPELLLSTAVVPDRPIERPREVFTGSHIVRARTGPLADLPSAGAQRAERIDGSSVRVKVESGRTSEPALGEGEDPELLACSPMLSCDDDKVRDLARRAVGDAADEAAKAETARRFVHAYITRKDLSVGFAGAAEVARTRAGDCTEHAVLLAAVLRGAGIRARVVAGLVYADHVGVGGAPAFGYHLWTQALVGPEGSRRWVDLDATLSAERHFDATHIALAIARLNDPQGATVLSELTPLLGNVSITVERAQ
jgi:transglutaminase-like putative cysteine protease